MRVQYVQEKPAVTVEVDDDDEVVGKVKPLDLDLYLKSIPVDWVEPIRQGIGEWESIGGRIHFTNTRLCFEMMLGGQYHRFVRCGSSQVSIVRQKEFAPWANGSNLRDQYLNALDTSPVVARHARNNKMWVKYASLSPLDLQVLLRAARELVQQIRVEE